MMPSIIYEKFINDDFALIQDCFYEIGYKVSNAADFSTYQGWLSKGRKVKRGETALKIESTKPYPQPLHLNGEQVYNDAGKKQFRKYRKNFSLFHIEQTKSLAL